MVFLIFVPLSVGRGQENLSCTSISVTVPYGGRAELVTIDNKVDFLARRREGTPIQNEYLGRPYPGGVTFHWEGNGQPAREFEVHLEGRRGGKIWKRVRSEKLPTDMPGVDIYYASLDLPEAIVGGNGVMAEMLPSNLAPDEFDKSENRIAAAFPMVCPRLDSTRYLMRSEADLDAGLLPGIDKIDPAVIDDPALDRYDGLLDSRNHPPEKVRQNGWRWQFDCRNVLCIDRAATTFDWEDGALVIGTGADGDIGEVIGGLYSNFHYTVVPCSDEIRRLYGVFMSGLEEKTPEEASRLMRCANDPGCNLAKATGGPTLYVHRMSGGAERPASKYAAYRAMQVLLHIARGKLHELGDRETARLNPQLLASGMLPGPFLSKRMCVRHTGNGDDRRCAQYYDQCEWFDTSYHAPYQQMNYRNFCIWDWDSDPGPKREQCAMILLWEGDGAATERARHVGWIGDTDISDDFIGMFEVRRDDFSKGPVEQQNFSGHLTIEFVTRNRTACR